MLPLSLGTSEFYLKPTNFQWLLASYLLSLATGRIRKIDWIVTPSVILTGPFGLTLIGSILSIKLFELLSNGLNQKVYKHLTERNILIAILLCFLILISYISPLRDIEPVISIAVKSMIPANYAAFVYHIFYVILILATIVIWPSLRRFEQRLYVFLVIYWLAFGLRFAIISPHQPMFGPGGGRYFYIPELCLLYAFFFLIERTHLASRIHMVNIYLIMDVLYILAQPLYLSVLPYKGSYAETWLPRVKNYYQRSDYHYVNPPVGNFVLPNQKN